MSERPKIEYVEGTEEGKYCSNAIVNFTSFEFIFDFGLLIPGIKELGKEPVTRIHTRIRTSPQHAKALLDVLQRKIDEYQNSTGVKLEIPRTKEGQQPYV